MTRAKYMYQIEDIKRVFKEEGELFCIKNPVEASEFFISTIALESNLKVMMIVLSTKNEVLSFHVIHEGEGMPDSRTMAKEMTEKAYLNSGASVMFAINHNHEGGFTPTTEELNDMHYLKDQGDLIGVQVLDCIVLRNDKGYSLASNGDL